MNSVESILRERIERMEATHRAEAQRAQAEFDRWCTRALVAEEALRLREREVEQLRWELNREKEKHQ